MLTSAALCSVNGVSTTIVAETATVANGETSEFGRWLQRRIDSAFLSIYSANMSIIHGATIYTLVYRAIESLIYKHNPSKYEAHFYTNHVQLIFSFCVVLGIIFWVASEYYWFMILIRRRPSPIATVAHNTLRA